MLLMISRVSAVISSLSLTLGLCYPPQVFQEWQVFIIESGLKILRTSILTVSSLKEMREHPGMLGQSPKVNNRR